MVGLTKIELMIEDAIKNNEIDCKGLREIFLNKDIEKIRSLMESQIGDFKKMQELDNQAI
jgi:flagellar motor component MotA